MRSVLAPLLIRIQVGPTQFTAEDVKFRNVKPSYMLDDLKVQCAEFMDLLGQNYYSELY